MAKPASASDDDDRLPGEIAAEIADDDDIDDSTAVRRLLAMMIDNQDFQVSLLIDIKEALDMRTTVRKQ